MADLTQKQEAFCLAYIKTGNASESYRRAYAAGKMSPESIHVAACRVLAHHNVALRIQLLRDAAVERAMVTIESLTAELEDARQLAKGEGQAAAAVAAIMGKAKLHGLIIDKKDLRSGDGSMSPAPTLAQFYGDD